MLDLHDYFGIDLTPAMMRERSWWWLSQRVVGLLSVDRGPLGNAGSRLQRALVPVRIQLPGTAGHQSEG